VSPRPTLIAQISDLHVKPPGVLAYRKVDTAAGLARCIAELNRLAPRPDLVVISGDLADTPRAEDYDHLETLLAPLAIPLAAVPGNHDDRALLRAALPDQPYASADGPLNSLRQIGDLDVVLVDSSVPGAPHGELDSTTLAWLDTTLAASTTRPALLFLHHPPFVTGIAHMDVQNLRNAADLAAILRRHPRARLVAAGHVHRATLTTFAGIPATICPAPSHAVALDLAHVPAKWSPVRRQGHAPTPESSPPPSFRVEPPAFHLHVWIPGEPYGSVVTHHVPIGDFDGPHPFYAADGRLL
jgi:3',5'-cyclic AMP phosphodiesterase CpdA